MIKRALGLARGRGRDIPGDESAAAFAERGRARKSATGSADSSMGLGMRRRWRRRYRAKEAALAAVAAASTRTASFAAAATKAGSGISVVTTSSAPRFSYGLFLRIFLRVGNCGMDRSGMAGTGGLRETRGVSSLEVGPAGTRGARWWCAPDLARFRWGPARAMPVLTLYTIDL